MQLLSSSTNGQGQAQRCAEQLLDSLPPVMRFVRKHMSRHRSKRISIMQFRAMALLRSAPAANLSAVAEFLGASLPTTSRVVSSLVSEGIIARRERERDRRQVELQLTPRGAALMEKARHETQTQLTRELSALSEDDQAVLLKALKMLHAVFAPGLRATSAHHAGAAESPTGTSPHAVRSKSRVPGRGPAAIVIG